LDVIRGEASFIDARTVKVERAGSEALRLSAEKIAARIAINSRMSATLPLQG
jgi:pyruvate/2-oxoglutarate dehydrogenase complex dihydrolipoamide dehydrogenase (E3) component